MDNRVKLCVLFLFLLFLILTTKNNIAFITLLTLSLTTIFYNLKRGVSIYLLLGFTGIYISTLLRHSVERFQDSTSTSLLLLLLLPHIHLHLNVPEKKRNKH